MRDRATGLFILGVALVLLGVGPIGFSMGVGNHIIDNNKMVECAQLDQDWSDWAFSPKFVVPLVFGIGCAGAALLRIPRPKRRHYLENAAVLVAATGLISACAPGWILF